jgi:hypothetical protein
VQRPDVTSRILPAGNAPIKHFSPIPSLYHEYTLIEKKNSGQQIYSWRAVKHLRADQTVEPQGSISII